MCLGFLVTMTDASLAITPSEVGIQGFITEEVLQRIILWERLIAILRYLVVNRDGEDNGL